MTCWQTPWQFINVHHHPTLQPPLSNQKNTLEHSSLEHPIVAHEIADVTTQIIFVWLHRKNGVIYES